MTPDFLLRVSNTSNSKLDYADLCAKQTLLISEISSELINKKDEVPTLNAKVLTIQDLSSIGKGIFISTHFYTKHGFVANITDDDPYGYITQWCYLPEDIIDVDI